MSKKLAIIFLALIVGATFFGCAKVAETTSSGGGGGSNVTNVTGSPPAGTTAVQLSAGNVVASGANLSLALTALNQSNTALTGMGGGNFTGAVFGANPSISGLTASTTLTAVCSMTVTTMTYGGVAVSAAMVMDKSGSMWTDKLVSSEVAAKLFVDLLASASANNRAGVINFDDIVKVDCPMTDAAANKQTLYNAITNEAYGGSTALFDAIKKGVYTASTETTQVKAVVALTDGGENASSSLSTTEVVNASLANGSIPIYTIGLFESTAEALYTSYTGDTYRGDLQKIAAGTNGTYNEIIVGVTGLSLSAKRVQALGALSDLYSKISQALTQSYTMTWSFATTLSPGTYWAVLTLQSYGSFTGQIVVVQFTVI
jgi:hypothetical protein